MNGFLDLLKTSIATTTTTFNMSGMEIIPIQLRSAPVVVILFFANRESSRLRIFLHTTRQLLRLDWHCTMKKMMMKKFVIAQRKQAKVLD